MTWWTGSSQTELQLLLLTFVLCALIGLERQFRQKAAGFRTHVLVGIGSAVFTLVSAFGFSTVLGEEVVLDPSRIAAGIVSRIGFLGAGVIFTRRDVVRGLTTAATIWVSAAVGMAAGAGMVSLAIGLTALHLFTLIVMGPLVAHLPTRDTNRIVRVTYNDAQGVLRTLLARATSLGFSTFILSTWRHDDSELVQLDARFKGKPPLQDLVSAIHEIDGVRRVRVRSTDSDDDEDSQN
ncbi:MAG TPA: MgtC/SapB family protein [Beutenbergiaceae bacterium]|nr:MgtC/SapB family protein [Beutenbergiaceae bacterium]